MPRVKGTFVSGGETARGQRWDAFKKCQKIVFNAKARGSQFNFIKEGSLLQ